MLLCNILRRTKLLHVQFTFCGTAGRAVYKAVNSSGIPKLADPILLFIKQYLRSEPAAFFIETKLE